MTEYKIIKITDLNGNDRTDGRYPIRIGRTCMIDLDDINKNLPMYIDYLKDADGSDYSDNYLMTSRVQSAEVEEITDGLQVLFGLTGDYCRKRLVVTTLNTIYTFEQC